MRLGLVGKSLGHSFSKNYFLDLFKSTGVEGEYENYEFENLAGIRETLSDLKGFNVTIPYKEGIIESLDELSEEASKVGAVNTVLIDNDKWIGFNTDVHGFRQSIKPFLRNIHEKALVLGTGGASKAVAYVLKDLGIGVIYISRNPRNNNEFSYEEVNEHMLRACKLIVNTTPVGMFPNVDDTIQFPFEYLTDDHLVVDLIYNPAKTKFLAMAEQNGASILNGESMLLEQAKEAWNIWSNV